eukprot:1177194-Prorocentrum_minimum.AAC.4
MFSFSPDVYACEWLVCTLETKTRRLTAPYPLCCPDKTDTKAVITICERGHRGGGHGRAGAHGDVVHGGVGADGDVGARRADQAGARHHRRVGGGGRACARRRAEHGQRQGQGHAGVYSIT